MAAKRQPALVTWPISAAGSLLGRAGRAGGPVLPLLACGSPAEVLKEEQGQIGWEIEVVVCLAFLSKFRLLGPAVSPLSTLASSRHAAHAITPARPSP